jgi:hypothetical protein
MRPRTEREVQIAMNVILEAVQNELAEFGRHPALGEPLDRVLGREAIADEIRDRADL